MSDVIGKGVIEVTADATKLKAGIEDAKRSVRGLGGATRDENNKASASIDRYVKGLQTQTAVMGKSAREATLYKLALRGASDEQIRAADSALRLQESFRDGERIGAGVRRGFLALGTAAATGLIAAAVAFDQLVKKAGDFQDLAEKTGDTAENIASLAVAAGTTGTQMDTLAAASVKLTKGLTGVDDETKDAGAAITALGLDIEAFKKLAPADQFEEVGRALARFKDSTEKTAVAVALFGKSGAEILPFLKELGAEGGRQFILTQEQIRAADEYADAQARLRSELSLTAQALAVELIPYVTDAASALRDFVVGQDGATTATNALRSVAQGLGVVFQTIAVVAANVAFVFGGVGREIGAIAAQLVALARLDLRGFSAISDAVREDAARARRELDAFENRILNLGNAAPKFKDPRILGPVPSIAEQARELLPKINFQGAVKPPGGAKRADNTAEQEAKAQLAADLDRIKQTAAAQINAFANGEKILEALRRAGLVDERDYYAAKRGYLIANEAEQANALQAEIARLQAEKTVGKERIENERKIADAQARLDKLRADAAVNIDVLALQETTALSAIEQGYRDAEAAAQDFLDGIRRANARELAGIGAGTQERGRAAGRAQIEDKFEEERRRLEQSRRDAELSGTFGPDSQRKYDAELERIRRFQAQALAEWDDYYAARLAAEADVNNGASEAFKNYISEATKTAALTEQLFTNAFQGMEDALVDFVTTGKLDFSKLATSIVADITRIIIQQQISNALGLVSDSSGGSSAASFATSALSALIGGTRAIGGPVSAGGIYQVNERGPELLAVGGKQYLMMGSQGGQVTPTAGTGGDARPISVVNQFTISGPTDRRSQAQVAAAAGLGVRTALARNT